MLLSTEFSERRLLATKLTYIYMRSINFNPSGFIALLFIACFSCHPTTIPDTQLGNWVASASIGDR